MADTYSVANDPNSPNRTPQIVIRNEPPKQPWLGRTFTKMLLALSIFGNIALYGMYQQYYPNVGANERFQEGERYAEDKVAIIKVNGMILRETVQPAIRELDVATEDDSIKAVVLAVDTPGGTISGSDVLYKELLKFKEKTGKPVVVSMQGMATSGGYYISVPADKIYCEKSCMTGSVGVIFSSFSFEKLMNDWGVQPQIIKSGPMKDAGALYRTMTDEEQAYWQDMIDKMFAQFLNVITTNRGEKVSEEQLRNLQGKVVLAEEAKEMGLIDEIGYESDAIEAAKSLAGLGDKVRIVTFDRPLAGLLSLLQGKASTQSPLDWNRLLQLQLSQPLLLPEFMMGRVALQ